MATLPRPSEPPRFLALAALLAWGLLIMPAGTFSLQPLDRDESRFMQATTQMLETGDFITIRFQDTERNKKPAGIYWLQAASVTAFSDPAERAPWAYRLPSLLAGLAAIALAYLAGCRLLGERAAFWAAFLFAAAPSLAGEATIAKTDATLTALVCGAQAALAAIFLRARAGERPGWTAPVLLWIAVGAGILVKGPVAPMISVLTIATLGLWLLAQRLNPLPFALACRPLTGLAILALMVGPWAAAIGLATDGRFFTEAVGTDMLGKVGTAQESHHGPAGYHLAAVWIMFWPAALFVPLALWQALRRWREPGIAFCLAWLVPAWLVFELSSTKLTHYTLPLYPAIALLCGAAIDRALARAPGRGEWLARAAGVLAALAAGGVILYGFWWLLTRFEPAGPSPVQLAGLAAMVVAVLGAAALVATRRLRGAAGLAGLAGVVLAWTLFEGTLARLEAFRLSPRLSATLAEAGLHPRLQGAPPVALTGYNEPSAVFLLGTGTLHLAPADAAGHLASHPGHVAVIDSEHNAAFLTALGGRPVRVVAQLDGFNYSNNHATQLTVYQAAPDLP